MSFKNTKNNKVRSISNFGSFLTEMIMPVNGAFIGYGLLSVFLENIHNSTTALLMPISQIIFNILIVGLAAFFGGKQIYGIRGGVIALITSAGFIFASSTAYYINISNVILSWPSQLQIAPIKIPEGPAAVVSGDPMILGAMIGGPLSAWIFKRLESWWSKYLPSGYEMLINNISIGIYIAIVAIAWFYGLSAVVAFITALLIIVIWGLKFYSLSWLLPFVVEPAKVFYLNNAVNLGIFTSLGNYEVQNLGMGKSMFFYIEPMPAAGISTLLIFYFFSNNKALKTQALAAMPLVFFGGIFELYFPFVLTNLFLLPVLMVGGAIAVGLYTVFNVGAISTISPGSIVLDYAFTHPDLYSYIGFSLGWIANTAFNFVVGSALMLFVRQQRGERVFFSFKLHYQNVIFQKHLNPKNLEHFSKKREIKDITYERIPAKTYLLEKIVYDNNTNEQFIISDKTSKIINFAYQEITKKKRTKYYLYRIFEKQKPVKVKKTYGFVLKPNQYVKRQQINLDVNPAKIKSITYELSPNYLYKRKVIVADKKHQLKTYEEIINPELPRISFEELKAKSNLN